MRSLILALALWSSPIFAADRYETYATSKYTYCDAEAVAAAFSMSAHDAKVYIGQKIGIGATDFLDETILNQKRQSPGQFCDSSGVGSVTPAPSLPAAANPRYDACHIKMLATVWVSSPSEAKARVADMAGNDLALLERDLARARERAKKRSICTFSDTPYTISDAEVIAKSWGTSVAETKGMIVDKYAWGAESNIPEYLKQMTGNTPGAQVFDGCHGKMLAAVWNLSVLESKSLAADKVRSNRPALNQALQRGRDKLGSGQVRCDFVDTRFSYSDAERVAKAWSISVTEAKSAIVDKYKWGSEVNVPNIR